MVIKLKDLIQKRIAELEAENILLSVRSNPINLFIENSNDKQKLTNLTIITELKLILDKSE